MNRTRPLDSAQIGNYSIKTFQETFSGSDLSISSGKTQLANVNRRASCI